MVFTQVVDGDWVRPYRRGYKVKCCDCGLVHKMNFRINKGHVEFQAFRIKKRKKKSK